MPSRTGLYCLYASFIIALGAMLGSLYASEVLGLQPCVLCWYQRILMYPLATIIAIGIIRKDANMHQYILPFSVTGTLFALYHYALYLGVIPEKLAPCAAGVSCTQRLPELFGFVNVITLSFAAFAAITLLMLIYRKTYENE